MSGPWFENISRGVGLRARFALGRRAGALASAVSVAPWRARAQRSAPLRVVAVALFALALCLVPGRAFAVVNLGTVTVAAPGSVSLASGDTVSVSAACDPAFSDQLPCCLSDYCPSGCDFDKEYGATGVSCADASGQCTCFGYSYSRYYPTCTVSSSDPSVARATWADGALVVSGYKPGTATVTIYPSMRLWSGAPASVTVSVSAGAGSGSGGAAGGSGAATGGSAAPAGGGAAAVVQRDSAATGGTAAAATGGGATNQMTGQATNNVETVVRTIEVASTQGEASVVETESGDVVAHLDDEATDLAALLSDAAGRDVLLSLWGGTSPETPDYIWTVGGLKLPAGSEYDYAGIDLSLDEVTFSNDALRAALGDEPFSAFSLAGSGKLPCTMQLMWRSVGTVDNGQVVDVYLFDAATGSFKKVHSNLTTAEGYVTFNLIERGTYVVTADSDLSEGSAEAKEAAGATVGAEDATAGAATGFGFPAWGVAAAIACVAAIVAAAAFFAVRRGKRS